MSHRPPWWLVSALASAIAAAEWLRRPSLLWTVVGALAVAAALIALVPFRTWRPRWLAGVLVGLIATIAVTQARLTAIETRWAEQRERRVQAASERLAGDLHAALHQADRLAQLALAAPTDDRAAAIRLLQRLVPNSGLESSLALLDPEGDPWAWAGRHRLPPLAEGDSIGARANGYYVVLEARRHSPDGRIAVAGVLIWAHPAVPDRSRSLAELFRESTEVGLAVYPPGAAPDSIDVFDYEEPTTAGPRVLFSVQPIPPEQGTAKQRAYVGGSRLATWLILLAMGFALSLTASPVQRFAVLGGLLWLVVRAPVGAALGLQPYFSPATFFRPLLGPLSGSAGALALAGALLTIAGVWLWRRRLPRRWYGVALGSALLLVAPYLISSLGRGITPPAGGVSVALWLSWQLAILVSAAALIVPTAALFRGPEAGHPSATHIVVGVTIAVAAATVGVVVWSPRGGWPDWYTFLWTPALFLVALPAPRWATVSGIALVAGSAAALVTWGAELQGKIQVAERDVARLGVEPDPLALPLLEGFAEQIVDAPAPANGTEMYALWRGSALGEQGYPSHLALWTAAGAPIEELALDSLDLPLSLLSTMVRELGPGEPQRITQIARVPGVHYVLLVRVAAEEVLTVGVGPRSQLIETGRVGRLLEPGRTRSPLYRLTLSPPVRPSTQLPRPRWRREGWTVRNEYPLVLPSGTRVVHAAVDLRGPVPLFVRGVLVVLFDAAVLGSLWFLAEVVSGARPPRPRWRSLLRSFRIRLAATLGLFFIVPAVGFAAWSFSRLTQEVERSRDLLITQILRDAAITADGALSGPPDVLEERLEELSRRVDADLGLYEGGQLIGTSTPVLEDLGVVPQLMDPAAFAALALEGELEVTLDGSIRQPSQRVGYRVVEPGFPSELDVLATPQPAEDPSLAVRRLDLALVLLLATLLGVGAALAGAGRASRALSRPVAELRRSALALGKGDPMPAHRENPPLEFEPVFGAFERMAADVRSSQHALEAARKRTAAVLATVATGVVGLDPDGRVLIANPRAMEILGTTLREGDPFLERLGPEWSSLAVVVTRFLEAPEADATAEMEVDGRRLTLDLAPLGPDVRGVVIAVNDVTDLSRAERVLAWGEMARQVAHEIKNPLTPMRLGMQHLTRVYRDRRGDFDRTLKETAERMLGEIDRLDTIARAFSRFAAPAGDEQPLNRVDLRDIIGEVVQLYRLAEEGCEVELRAERPSPAAARPDEVKEVMVNLLENARNAGARRVTVQVKPGEFRVSDDGAGISAELLPRIFEPRFSTTTSGSGLGLAIVKRLVESWGGRIEVESEAGQGTTIAVYLPA
ncbi:MAG TPA: ATP-binding protein [Gemmatimonadales bacterium]|nr:ATP-binding protein [Gemmatimonadales bacterium]